MNRTLLVLTAIFFNTVLVAGNQNSNIYQLPSGVTKNDFAEKTIIAKVNPSFRSLCTAEAINIPSIQLILESIGSNDISKIYPHHNPPEQMYNSMGKKLVDLSLMYRIKYSSDADLVTVINRLLRTGVFEYAEPKFIPHLTSFVPNDPMYSQQNHLTIIGADLAWNLSTGDTNVVIGITDTGTDTNHPDLEPNVKKNYLDPVNGVDDDNDGYTDNYTGWDLGENDNDPQVGNCGTCTHGSHVAGCANAVTNNNLGVASPSFNCKHIPIKINDASGVLISAYEGITYAADHGCQIINCSWGGPGGSSYGQDIVNYAVYNKNALVVAGAGNGNSPNEFWPCAYDNVLCIGSTNNADVKSSFSNYGTWLDVCAPGSNILATYYDDGYSVQSGTSMASPVAAGAAALVKSAFPNYTGLQVGEKLRVTAFNIYGLNTGYLNQLGSGRINLYNALTASGPSIRMENIIAPDNNDNVLVANDTMRISGDIINYLDPTTNLTITLTTSSPDVTIIDGTTVVGVLGTLATTTNLIDPFTVVINPFAPQNAPVEFKLTFNDGTYSATQSFIIKVNVDYINILNNEVYTTNTSRGRIGYNSDAQTEGKGFDFNDEGSLLYEAGLMIGMSNDVSDVVRGTSSTPDEDFISIQAVQKNDPGVWSDFDTYGVFNDNTALFPLNVTVWHRTMSWTLPPYSRFHIWEYSIHNSGPSTLSNLYAGIFADWDVDETTFADNKADQDASLKMGYVYDTNTGGYYVGIKLLSSGGWNHYALDNITGGGGGVDASDGFNANEKFITLSTSRPTAGGTGTGNDVLDVVSTGPFTIASNDSVVAAFALVFGEELSELQLNAQNAQIKYNQVVAGIENPVQDLQVANAYPNPANDVIKIPVQLRTSQELYLQIFDETGRIVKEEYLNLNAGAKEIVIQTKQLAAGNYIYTITGDKNTVNGKFLKN